jgi:hypothetical protein
MSRMSKHATRITSCQDCISSSGGRGPSRQAVPSRRTAPCRSSNLSSLVSSSLDSDISHDLISSIISLVETRHKSFVRLSCRHHRPPFPTQSTSIASPLCQVDSVFGNLSFVSSCPDVVDAVYMFQSQGLATNIVSSSRNVIGQYDLALKCGTDRDDETTVRSYSFLRHTPFCAYQRYFGYCLIYWHSFGILATETSHLVDELSSQLPISSLCFSAMAALGPGFNQSNGGSPAPTTPRGQASKEINAIVELTASEFELPLRSRVGTFSPSKRLDGYAERCIDHINFLFFRNRIVMNDVFNQFRKDRADGCISGDLLEAFYTRTRDAVYLEKHKPQLEKLQLNKTTAQQDPQSKKPAPKLSLTQTKLIPTIKRSP